MLESLTTWRTLRKAFFIAAGQLVEKYVDVDIWHYRYYAELPYVTNLYALLAEQLKS